MERPTVRQLQSFLGAMEGFSRRYASTTRSGSRRSKPLNPLGNGAVRRWQWAPGIAQELRFRLAACEEFSGAFRPASAIQEKKFLTTRTWEFLTGIAHIRQDSLANFAASVLGLQNLRSCKCASALRRREGYGESGQPIGEELSRRSAARVTARALEILAIGAGATRDRNLACGKFRSQDAKLPESERSGP